MHDVLFILPAVRPFSQCLVYYLSFSVPFLWRRSVFLCGHFSVLKEEAVLSRHAKRVQKPTQRSSCSNISAPDVRASHCLWYNELQMMRTPLFFVLLVSYQLVLVIACLPPSASLQPTPNSSHSHILLLLSSASIYTRANQNSGLLLNFALPHSHVAQISLIWYAYDPTWLCFLMRLEHISVKLLPGCNWTLIIDDLDDPYSVQILQMPAQILQMWLWKSRQIRALISHLIIKDTRVSRLLKGTHMILYILLHLNTFE